jgi:hypothetical protein
MFGDRRLIVISLICFAGLAACSTNPPAPSPVGPTPAPLHGYHLTLYDQNGKVTQRYDVGTKDIVSDDPIHQDISFRVGGQVQHFHGSYQKDRY